MRRVRAAPRNNALQKNAGQLRIIGGEWRGRKIRFPGVAGLRPTPDRVRETLFNWLAPVIGGSRCLDLFAGSGALGLEALSRGAAAVAFVERDRNAAQQLSETAAALAQGRATVHQADVTTWLAGPATPFDIVFVDPPYDSGLLPAAMQLLETGGWLAADAFIYLEAPARAGKPAMPTFWSLHRSGRAGAVGYHLARRLAAGGRTT
jgi:16S rRNA (guanine966-N2)-methyltransferase